MDVWVSLVMVADKPSQRIRSILGRLRLVPRRETAKGRQVGVFEGAGDSRAGRNNADQTRRETAWTEENGRQGQGQG